MKSPKRNVLLIVLLLTNAVFGGSESLDDSGNGRESKPWYDFVFFSPVTAVIVGSGFIGWMLMMKGKSIDRADAVKLIGAEHRLESLSEYQGEATKVFAPLLEANVRLEKLLKETPQIADNRVLVERLSDVLEPYSRFRARCSEEFRVFTRRYASDLERAFEYVNTDFCDVIIYFSSDANTRNSDQRVAEIREAKGRLDNNVVFIEEKIKSLIAHG